MSQDKIEETVSYQIPLNKVMDFITDRLVEIEARQIFLDANVKILLGRLREKEDGYNFDTFLKDCDDEMRRNRLELAAAFIKKYS